MASRVKIFFGSKSIGAVTGTLAVTEGADVAAFVGSPVVTGLLAVTEGADIAAFAGSSTVTGPFAVTEGADVALFAGTSTVTGPLDVTEGADVAAFTQTLSEITGTLAVTEGSDSSDFAGTSTVTGLLDATEGADIVLFAGTTPVVESTSIGTGGWGARLNAEVKPLSSRKKQRDPAEEKRRKSLLVLEAAINAAMDGIEEKRSVAVVDLPELPVEMPAIDWAAIERDRQAYRATKRELEAVLLELKAVEARLQAERDDEDDTEFLLMLH